VSHRLDFEARLTAEIAHRPRTDLIRRATTVPGEKPAEKTATSGGQGRRFSIGKLKDGEVFGPIPGGITG